MGFETAKNSTEELKTINAIQIELAQRFFGYEDKENIVRWIGLHSKKFREVVTAHPEFLADFARDKETALLEIEKELYEVFPAHYSS